MTEAEWLTCTNLDALIKELGRNASRRKRRLFACACCRRVWDLIPFEQGRAAVSVAEQFADGLVGEAELERHERAVKVARFRQRLNSYSSSSAADACINVAAKLAPSALGARSSAVWAKRWKQAEDKGTNPELPDFRGVVEAAEIEELTHQAALLRDVFCNPFRPVTFDPEWRTTTVVQLAQGMYDSRDFGALPILADALQDAGCDNDDILAHCRGSGPHVRGCWVVDLVLGKE